MVCCLTSLSSLLLFVVVDFVNVCFVCVGLFVVVLFCVCCFIVGFLA